MVPAGAFPRLERAFARSAGAGMLDLLRHGLPLGAGAFPAWLREKAQELLMQHLQRLRRGDDTAPQLSPQQATAWLEGMPPVYGGAGHRRYLLGDRGEAG